MYQKWFAVGRYDITNADMASIENGAITAGYTVFDADESAVIIGNDVPFLSTAKNMLELRGSARQALPTFDNARLMEVLSVTRESDMEVLEFE